MKLEEPEGILMPVSVCLVWGVGGYRATPLTLLQVGRLWRGGVAALATSPLAVSFHPSCLRAAFQVMKNWGINCGLNFNR